MDWIYRMFDMKTSSKTRVYPLNSVHKDSMEAEESDDRRAHQLGVIDMRYFVQYEMLLLA